MKKTDDPTQPETEVGPKRRLRNERSAKAKTEESVPTEAAKKWGASQYGTLELSGARKLSESRVAPLIARARGYLSIESTSASSYVKENLKIEGRSKQAVAFRRLFDNGSDVMELPWFSISAVHSFASDLARKEDESETEWMRRYTDGRLLRSSVKQFRPSTPEVRPDGSVAGKYVFLTGAAMVLDIHPATPASWVSSAPNIFMTEGVIKSDAALTELLLNAGVSWERLSETPDSIDEARARLALLMEQVEIADRFVIIALAGVTNWKNRPEWTEMTLRDKKFYVAFDGDVASNRNVHRQADALFDFLSKKRADVEMIDLSHDSALFYQDEPRDSAGKLKTLGVDDYFAGGVGRWTDLIALGTPDLPPMPEGEDEPRVGEFRISPDGNRLEMGVEDKDEFGSGSVRWASVPNHAIGGRIRSKVTRRKPTDSERADGKLRPANESSSDVGVEIEVKYLGANGEVATAIVTGPAAILAEHPGDWHKEKLKANVPSTLLLSPSWPPRKYGNEWVQAVKMNRSDEIEETTIWNSMRWVPNPSDGPSSFIVGRKVISDDPENRAATVCGIDESELPGADNFGVIDSYRFEDGDDTVELPQDQIDEEERKIIQTVFDALIYNGPWSEVAHGAVVLAAGLRPAAVLRNSQTIYCLGEPGSGKTWTAAQIMAFWQAWAGAWSKDSLPGSAKDTAASTELAVASTAIWAIDDWAPSPDPRRSGDDEARMGDIVRSVFNGSGKRRATATMGSRALTDPEAMLIVTAENELSVQSARERTIPLSFQRGALGRKDRNGRDVGIDRINKMNLSDGTSAKLTAAVIYDIIRRCRVDQKNEWSGIIEWEKGQIKSLTKYAERIAVSLTPEVPIGQATRQIDMAADICLGLVHLMMLTDRLGLEKISRKIVNPDYVFDSSEPDRDTLVYQVMRIVLETFYRKDSTRPGQVFVTAVRDMLQARTGHFVNGERAEYAPFDGPNQVALNAAVGWQRTRGDGPMEPQGKQLGWVYVGSDGEPFFVLHDETAFNAAKREYPANIQSGANKTTYITNIQNDETLIHPSWIERKREGKPWSVNRQATGTKRGTPLRWSAIMGDIDPESAKVFRDGRSDDTDAGEEKPAKNPAKKVRGKD